MGETEQVSEETNNQTITTPVVRSWEIVPLHSYIEILILNLPSSKFVRIKTNANAYGNSLRDLKSRSNK